MAKNKKVYQKPVENSIEIFELIKGAKGTAISPDAPVGFKEFDLENATQAQLEFLFKRNYPYVIKK